ncbi:MAG TPA: PASTA domain-containing protein [Candidatus Acidoferrales bacterium]|jgi:beta-lactam-binding protein with PASTA domain|nr:PASTA domain-containing protein [Candidatus Acidoferrales bacterium]
MVLKERLQWIFRMALLLFILSSVAFLSALTAMRFAVQGREVAMPDVVGKLAVPARQILRGRGVGMKVEDRIFSNLPVDTVVRQSPPPNIRVKTGQSAHVVLSLGPQKVTIPQLQDRSLRAAQVELLRGGMQLGEVSSAYLPGEMANTVTEQNPAPGNTEVTGPHVNLLVSLGPRPAAYVMPELSGLPIAEAQAKLGSAGLRLSKLTPQPASDLAAGTVVGQTPARGERVDSSATIELQVAE